MDPRTNSDSSLLLWTLGALVLAMAAHILLGWIRQSMDLHGLPRLRAVLIGAATFGTAHSVAITLGLAGEALGFAFGYHLWGALALWLGAIALTVPVSLLPAARRDTGSTIGAGILMALVVTGMQVGWLMAVGFRPGLSWQPGYLVAAVVVSGMGFGTALMLAFPRAEWARLYRYSWRVAAAGLMALSFLVGFSLVIDAADLPAQLGSIYQRSVPGYMLAMVTGAVLPLVLSVMVVDIEVRRRQRRRQARGKRRSPAGSGVHALLFDLHPEDLEALAAAEEATARREAAARAHVAPVAPPPHVAAPAEAAPSEQPIAGPMLSSAGVRRAVG